jgi:sulfonate transport system substrate-binding protein
MRLPLRKPRVTTVPVLARCLPAAVVALVAVTLVGGTGVASATTKAGSRPRTQSLSGIDLRVGDQQEELETLMDASGALKGAPYKVTWEEFADGPLVDAAFSANSIDIGGMGDVPASATVSSHLGLTAIAVTLTDGPGQYLLARPGIHSLAQLKGKKVAYTTGTEQQAFALRALHKAGLKQSQVQQVNVTLEQLGTVLLAGDVDASVVTTPYEIEYKQQHPGATILATDETVQPPIYDYELASKSALANPAKEAAIFDFVKRLVKARNWEATHLSQWVNDYDVGVLKFTPSIAEAVVKASGQSTYEPITPAVESAEQQMVGLMVKAGAIPSSFNVSPLYNPKVSAKYNAILKEVPQTGND